MKGESSLNPRLIVASLSAPIAYIMYIFMKIMEQYYVLPPVFI